MSIVNGYVTLASYNRFAKNSTDSDRDIVLEDLIEEVSRFIDDETWRIFYPRVETRYHDTPESGRELWVDGDLLEIITLTNGDDSTLSDSDYNLMPLNSSPRYGIKLLQSSSEIWDLDSSGNSEGVIDVLAIWGYHPDYAQRAWATGSTVSDDSDITAAATTIAVTALTLFEVDQLIRIEDEICRITATDDSTTKKLTVVRGENGSTAATHVDATVVYIWTPHSPVITACKQIVQNEYKRRYGEGTSTATVTAAGVVLTPDSIPGSAAKILSNLKRVM